MSGHTYLLRNRFGVYYLRMVIPEPVRAILGRKGRELRSSLATKDRKLAKQRLLAKVTIMTEFFGLFGDGWELDPEARFEVYKRGLALINQHGKRDLNDEFDLECLLSELGVDELKAYVFARTHQINKKRRKKSAKANAVQSTSATDPVPATTFAKAAQHLVPPSTGDTRPDATVRTAIERFAVSKRATVNEATAKTYNSQCTLFHKIIAAGDHDLMLSKLTPDHVHRYVDTLHKLPKKLDPQDPRPVDEIVDAATSRLSNTTKSSRAPPSRSRRGAISVGARTLHPTR